MRNQPWHAPGQGFQPILAPLNHERSTHEQPHVDIVLRPGTPKEKTLSGQVYLSNYGLPQFFFHMTTAYAILRHNGLDIGKRDYMGAY